jgi:hypothetical protein
MLTHPLMNKLLVAVPALALASTLTPASAAADVVAVQPAQLEQMCTGGTASATIALSTANNFGGSVTSPDANYMATGCKMYTVDVKFTGIGGSSTFLTVRTNYATSLNKVQCEKAQEQTLLYRKQPNANFLYVAGGVRRGKWNGSSCSMEGIGSYTQPATTFNESDIVRVVEVGIVGGSAEKVAVSVSAMKAPG